MFSIIIAAVIEIFKVLLPTLLKKANAPVTATDSPRIPKHIRDAWMRKSEIGFRGGVRRPRSPWV